jgi:uncharacterized protein YcgL (UPF0745 family)
MLFDAILSGSNSTIFYIQKALFWQKKLCTVMRTVKNSKMYLLIAREREQISQKFQRIWIQKAKTIFSMQKNLKNYDALLKILQNFHC